MDGRDPRINLNSRPYETDRSLRQSAFKNTKSQAYYRNNADDGNLSLDENAFFVPEPIQQRTTIAGSYINDINRLPHGSHTGPQQSFDSDADDGGSCGGGKSHPNHKKSFGGMLTSFRKGLIRTLSPSLRSQASKRSRSSPVKASSERKKVRGKSAHQFGNQTSVDSSTPRFGALKKKVESKLTSVKKLNETFKKNDQLSSYYIKDLANETQAAGDGNNTAEPPGENEAAADGKTRDHDQTATQTLFQDCKKEIDLLEQVANLDGSENVTAAAAAAAADNGDSSNVDNPASIETRAEHLINRTRMDQSMRGGGIKTLASFDREESLEQLDADVPSALAATPPQATTSSGSKSSKILSAIKKNCISFGETVTNRAVSFQPQTSLASDSQALTQQQSPPPQLTPAYFELRVRLKEGKNLAVRDVSGSSDPYAKFLLNGVNVYKSKIVMKNLNPQWSEEFTVKLSPSTFQSESGINSRVNSGLTMDAMSLMSSPSGHGFAQNQLDFFLSKFKLKIFVYDYDRGFLSDALIGYAVVDHIGLKDSLETSIEVELEDEKMTKYEYLGLITMDLLLTAKFKEEEKDNSQQSNPKLPTNSPVANVRGKRAPYQLWQCILNVVVIEGQNLLSMDDNGLSDPYVKFKLENERFRSKTVRRTLNPRFMEQFQLYIYDMNKSTLQLTVYDHDSAGSADDFMGKAQINLKSLEYEKTHLVKLPLEDGAGSISLLLTITGTYGPDSPSDIEHYRENNKLTSAYRDEIIRQYSLANTLRNVDDIGWLQVKVMRAEGLPSADINGKSDPFVTLQLINQFVQTHTEYKNLNPEWGKIYEFNVTDIHAILEINVLDEDKNKVYEFLGKLEIPIINIQNGKRKFYALKDRKLLSRTKGAIELEMNLIYNPLKAVIKTFNPRETRLVQPEPKLKIPILKQNIMRVGNIVQSMVASGVFIDSCFRWVSPVRSILAFAAFCFIVLNFEIYMLPLTLLMIFMKNYIILKFKAVGSSADDDDSSAFDYFEEGEDDSMDVESKEPKKSFRERLNEIQEICLKVQDTLDFAASLGERVINTFLFVSPWLSWLAIIVLTIATIILYTVPLRYLILVWGINKFTKKFRKPPDFIDNTEILDFLSRVPSKREYVQYRDLKYDKSNPQYSSGATTSSAASIVAKKKKKQ